MPCEPPRFAGDQVGRSWLLFILALVVHVPGALAQVNAENLVEAVTKPGWGGAGKSTLAYLSGNVDLLEVRGEVSNYFATAHPDTPPGSERFWFRDRLLVYGSAGIKRLSGEQVLNDGYGHARYTRMQWLRLGGEVFAQAQYDEFRLLSRRLLIGGGARVVFASMERLRAWGGTGYMIESERRAIPPENRPPEGPDPVRMLNHRWTSYITVVVPFIPDHLSLLSTAYVQPRFDDMGDLQVLHEAHLQVKVTDHLQITTDFMLRYDSRAPRSVEKRDIRIGNGLVYMY